MKTVVEYLDYIFHKIEKERNDLEALMNSKVIEANEIHKTVAKLVFDNDDTYNVFNASGSHVEFRNREVSQLKEQEDSLKLEADELTFKIKELNLELEKLSIAIAHANATNDKLNNLSNENIRLNAEVAMYATGGKNKKKDPNISELNSNNLNDTSSIIEEQSISKSLISSNPVVASEIVLDNLLKNEDDSVLQNTIVDDYSLDQKSVTDLDPINYTEDSDSFLRQVADRIFFLAHLVKTDPYRIKLELDEVYRSINKFLNK